MAREEGRDGGGAVVTAGERGRSNGQEHEDRRIVHS